MGSALAGRRSHRRSHSATARKTAPRSRESLAELLRTGPADSLAALHDLADALANHSAADTNELLDNVEALLGLMQRSMLRFHEFTAQLQMLVAQAVDESAKEMAARH